MNKKIIRALLILMLAAAAGILYCCTHNDSSDRLADTGLTAEEADITDAAEEGQNDIFMPESEAEKKGIWVYVSGEVVYPGVYYLDENARTYEAIDMAGGITSDAAEDTLNLAAVLSDGQHIVVPDRSSVTENVNIADQSGLQDEKSGLVNINTASSEELKTLPGIGDVRADAIISYRENNRFESIEDIMNVSGIKESLFNKIKELITV